MKKHLIAAAVAAAVAVPAAAQVTVYGVLDAGYSDTDTNTNGTSVTISTTSNGGNYTSQRLGFRGSEDLGGGLKANFVYELGIDDSDPSNSTTNTNVDGGTDTADSLSTRVATVGISGGFGAINIGRQNTAVEAAWSAGDVGGGNNFIGRAYTSSTKLNNSRSDGLISYALPTMAGLTVTIQHGRRDNEATNFNTSDKQTENGFSIAYSAGPLTAVLGQSSEKTTLNGATVNQPKQMVIGANYNLGMARAFLTYMSGEDKSNAGAVINDKDAVEVGVSIPFGATTLNASMFNGENKATTTTKDDLSGYQIGLLHALSKRTTAYAVIGKDETDRLDSADITKRDQYGFGIRHSF
jgi:predicted porin